MAKYDMIEGLKPSRSRRLLDGGLPAAALAAIGFSTLAVSLLLASIGRDFAATPFSASYAPGRNPWIATMADTVSLYDAKTYLSQLVDRAADGEEIMISKNGKPLARLMPLASKGTRRTPAGALGVIAIRPDFDDPLPPEIQAAFDGRD